MASDSARLSISERVHVFGGTSDALAICRSLESQGIHYSLSVATDVGEELAIGINAAIIVQRMDRLQMEQWLTAHQITTVIDATHPFAAEVSRNVLAACQQIQIPCLRFERPAHIDLVNDPLLIKVDSVEQACEKALDLGEKIFLTTGSKQLADYVRLLPNKELIARVLPTVEVLSACQALGLGVGNIVAMKGPFSQEINLAMYQFYQPDVVITKESGAQGGYQEKVLPCIAAGIPCIVIRRPVMSYQSIFSTVEGIVGYFMDANLRHVRPDETQGETV